MIAGWMDRFGRLASAAIAVLALLATLAAHEVLPQNAGINFEIAQSHEHDGGGSQPAQDNVHSHHHCEICSEVVQTFDPPPMPRFWTCVNELASAVLASIDRPPQHV